MRRVFGAFGVCGVIGVLSLVAGCATALPEMTAPALVARGEQNLVKAQRDLAGRWVVVKGVIDEMTLATRESAVAYGYGYSASAHIEKEQLPVAVLHPGTVLCYFEPDDIDLAADLRKGDSVTLTCVVDSFRVDKGDVLAVLGSCSRKRRP